MFQSTPLALYLFAAAFALQAASAPVTTSLLLPNDNLGDSLPFTFSEAGVGSDGRTTYVATQSQSGAVDMITYALGPSDFVLEDALVVSSMTETASEGCSFATGATAGAVGACTMADVGPSETGIASATETLAATSIPILLKANSAAPAVQAGFLLSAVLGVAVLAL